MAEMYMDVDVALAGVPVNVFPLTDDTDFKTREESVTYDQSGMDLLWNFITTAGVFTQTAVTPTTSGVYDWTHLGNGMYSLEIPASGGGTINNDAEGTGWFSGFATGILPWRGPFVTLRAAGLNNLLIDTAFSATRGLVGTALPAAAADAAGGVPISDAGGLDMDATDANMTLALADTADMQPKLGTITDLGAGATIGDNLADQAGATFSTTTDSQEAIRNRGDSAWITGGGGGITDMLNVHPILPTSIDLADTATVRLGLMLTNALDDLPSTAEITPGTIDIDRKAIGGTSWSSVVSAAACSEQAGMIYYDEVFDSGTGYAAGDSIRVTFKSQKITVSANDYEITDANGVMFQTEIRSAMRGTDSALLAASISLTGGAVDTVTTLTNKTGFSLVSTGLDAVLKTATGMVAIASAVWDRVLTGGTHNIATSAGRRLRGIQEFQGYEGGQVWIDTVAGTAGTTDYEHGTVEQPVDLIASANTIAASVGLSRFNVTPGSAITFGAGQTSEIWQGHGWTLALGGQDINNTHIFNASVTGIATAAAEMEFHDCDIGTGSFQKAHFFDCTFDGTMTVTAAGAIHVINGQSGVPGVGAPTFAFGVFAITAEFRRWSGSITFSGLTSDDTLTISGELGTIDLGAPASAVVIEIRGTYKSITNIGSASINTDGAIKGVDVASILVDTAEIGAAGVGLTDLGGMSTGMKGEVNAEADQALTDYDPPTRTEATSDKDAILTRLGTPADTDVSTDIAAVNTLIAALNDVAASDILTAQLTESYAADGAAPTLTQALMLIQQVLTDFVISGTTLSVKGVDGSTEKATLTLNDGTNPTGVTRAT